MLVLCPVGACPPKCIRFGNYKCMKRCTCFAKRVATLECKQAPTPHPNQLNMVQLIVICARIFKPPKIVPN